MSSPAPVTIHASGYHAIKRTPELVALHLRIHDESATPSAALEAVRAASAEVSQLIRELAPPKSEASSAAIDSEELDIDDEKRDAAFPVSSWSMQQLRTWTVTKDDDNHPPPRPQVRMMMAAAPAAAEEDKEPEKTYHAQVEVRATFHDFEKLSQVIATVTAKDLVSVSSLNWAVTRATRAALQTRVRRGAYVDALAKATDYAFAIAPNAKPRPTEVHDDSVSRGVMTAQRFASPMMMKGGGGGGEESMNFEPEPIEISAQVRAVFALDV